MNVQQINHGTTERVSFGTVQHNLSDIMPASSEIGYLWLTYLAESMTVCFLKSFVSQAKDPDNRPILQRALDVATQRVNSMEEIFKSIKHPIPEAYGENDVDLKAKQLFSESFTLLYTRIMHKFVLIHYSNALSVSYRTDIRQFFLECLNTSQEIHQKATDLCLAKGFLEKSPMINIPDRVEYIMDKGYIGKVFGRKRPLNAIEISHLYSMLEIKELISTLVLGYSQVVKSEKIRDYLSKAKQIIDIQITTLSSLLADEDIPQPRVTKILVTESKESPLSDKLILSHITGVIAYIITSNGLAETNTARPDLITILRGLVTEILGLAKDGAELLIENGWMEKIPETADRRELVH